MDRGAETDQGARRLTELVLPLAHVRESRDRGRVELEVALSEGADGAGRQLDGTDDHVGQIGEDKAHDDEDKRAEDDDLDGEGSNVAPNHRIGEGYLRLAYRLRLVEYIHLPHDGRRDLLRLRLFGHCRALCVEYLYAYDLGIEEEGSEVRLDRRGLHVHTVGALVMATRLDIMSAFLARAIFWPEL